MLTVRKFLELPVFSEFTIVSGINGLDNVISSVNIMDNPDALDWFSPGELLLTSGYFFKDSVEMQNQVVRQLRSINCPALCIKPKRYLKQIPQNIIMLSEELNLPLIELPYGMAFAKISNIIREEISGNYDILNKKSLDIHQTFFKISLEGGGISKISKMLSQMISNPVILLDKFLNIISWSDTADTPIPLKDYLDNGKGNSILNTDYIKSLPPEFELLQKPLARQLHIDGNVIDTVITSVYIQNIHYGYILVLNTGRDLTDIDYIALEHSTMSFALERIRNNELERTKNKIRRDFLDDLLMGNITDMENLKYLCDIHRVNINLPYTPIIFSLEFHRHENLDMIEKKRYEETKVLEVLNFLDNYGDNTAFVIHCLSIHGQIRMLVGFRKEAFDVSIQSMKNLCSEIVGEAESSVTGIIIRAGIGGTAKNLMDIHIYYKQAVEALRLVKKSPTQKRICHFDDFVVHNFLEQNINDMEMRRFFENTLGELYRYDKDFGTELVLTLEAWIENNLNIAKTSRYLYAHRNTILYRMERISSILNSNLKDANELLKYQLALKIYRLLDL